MEPTVGFGKTIIEGVLGALNRADELGGEARDLIIDRYDKSERAQRIVGRFRGAEQETVAEAAANRAAVATAAAAAAPPPASEQPGERDIGLASAEIPVQVYGRTSCPWTGRALTLLNARTIDYDYIDLDEPENEDRQPTLIEETRQNTVPYVFLRGEFLGGYNALSEVERLGQLEYLTLSADERKSAKPALRSITVVARPNTDEVAPGEAGS